MLCWRGMGEWAGRVRPVPVLARLCGCVLALSLLLAQALMLATPALAAEPVPDGRGVAQPGSLDRCAPQDMRVRAVPESRLSSSPLTRPPSTAPDALWTEVSLPDNWNKAHRWRGMDGAVWYRVDWTLPCAELRKRHGRCAWTGSTWLASCGWATRCSGATDS